MPYGVPSDGLSWFVRCPGRSCPAVFYAFRPVRAMKPLAGSKLAIPSYGRQWLTSLLLQAPDLIFDAADRRLAAAAQRRPFGVPGQTRSAGLAG